MNLIPFGIRIRESLLEDNCEAYRRPINPKTRSMDADTFTMCGCLWPPRSTWKPGLRAVVSGHPIQEGVCLRQIYHVTVLL